MSSLRIITCSNHSTETKGGKPKDQSNEKQSFSFRSSFICSVLSHLIVSKRQDFFPSSLSHADICPYRVSVTRFVGYSVGLPVYPSHFAFLGIKGNIIEKKQYFIFNAQFTTFNFRKALITYSGVCHYLFIYHHSPCPCPMAKIASSSLHLPTPM